MSKFPDFYGFCEFPNYQNYVPNDDWKSQELGKFPTSSNTEFNLSGRIETDPNVVYKNAIELRSKYFED